MKTTPKVSVIIPTIGRESLVRAVKSVQAQVECVVEVIVVLDIPENESVVREYQNDLNFTLLLNKGKGAPAARNTGLDAANGDYISYLDDDDEWLPNKCVEQIAALNNSSVPSHSFSVALSDFVGGSGSSQTGTTKQKFTGQSSIGNYLVERRTLRYGSTYFQTASLLGPKNLMKKCRWDESLPKHQDWDMFIRLVDDYSAEAIQIDSKLVRVHQGSAGSISRSPNWSGSLQWLEKHHHSITGRARADFLAIHVSGNALTARSLRGVAAGAKATGLRLPHAAAVLRMLAAVPLIARYVK